MRSIFIDESKSKGFLLCAVEVEASEVPSLRRAIGSLRLKGQSDIHFVSESARRKREILSRLSGFGLRTLFISGYGAKEAILRRASLEHFVSQLSPRTDYQVWLDLDESHLALDKKHSPRPLPLEDLVNLSLLVTLKPDSNLFYYFPMHLLGRGQGEESGITEFRAWESCGRRVFRVFEAYWPRPPKGVSVGFKIAIPERRPSGSPSGITISGYCL